MNRDRGWLGLIVIASVGARLIAAAAFGDRVEALPGVFDQISYHTLALRVLSGHGFTFAEQWWPMTAAGAPTAFWSYLYVVFVASVYGLVGPHPFAVRVIQAVTAGSLMPILSFRLARRVLPGESSPNEIHWAALAAAGWSAAYIYFIYYTAALLTEPFFMTGVLWSLDCMLRLSNVRSPVSIAVASGPADWLIWTELGLALTITTYLRQAFLLCVPVLLAWVVLSRLAAETGIWRDRVGITWRKSAGGLLAALGLMAVLIAPATLFNYEQFGRLVLLNTNAGYAFFWANHPIYGDHFVGILPNNTPYTDLIPIDLRSLNTNEAALDSALLQRGIGFVLADPARYVRLSLSRIPVFFLFWPTSDSGLLSNAARVASFGLAVPFMVVGLVLWLADWQRPERRASVLRGSLLVLFAMVYSLIHLLSWALTRYRLPVDAVGLIFGARALVSGIRRVLQRQ